MKVWQEVSNDVQHRGWQEATFVLNDTSSTSHCTEEAACLDCLIWTSKHSHGELVVFYELAFVFLH